jgi:hypothetical protein
MGSGDDELFKYMGFASFSVLIWDHIITFDREVEFIWPAKKNLRLLSSFWLFEQTLIFVVTVIYLFFLVRAAMYHDVLPYGNCARIVI